MKEIAKSIADLPNQIPRLADLLAQLGDVPQERILLHPFPGTATEEDLLEVMEHHSLLCELVDGVLVEKAMGFESSLLAGALIELLRRFVRPRKLGVISGADGTVRLCSGLIRIPDVAFVSWSRLPGHRVPKQPIPTLAPDLAIEVLSKHNTPAEMARKLGEYFAAGVLLVWIVDPFQRVVSVYTSPEDCLVLAETDVLDGGTVLPGFQLALAELFAELDETGE